MFPSIQSINISENSQLNKQFSLRQFKNVIPKVLTKCDSSRYNSERILIPYHKKNSIILDKSDLSQTKYHNINVIKGISEEKEIQYWDKQKQGYNGQIAVNQFNNYYKNIDKVTQQHKVKLYIKSAFYSILTGIEKSVLPSKLGIIRRQDETDTLQIKFIQDFYSNKYYGDRYMKALSNGIKQCPEITNIQLQNNRISEKGAASLFKSLHTNLQIFDISENNIGKIGCQLLSAYFKGKHQLKILNLSNNQIGDNNIELIIDGLNSQPNQIRILDLSKNFITNKPIQKLREFLDESNTLQELYLHWNYIKSEGCINIFDQLKNNQFLKVLDFSWNKVGGGKPSAVEQISDFMKDNKTLIHLDLSNNLFSIQESKQIAEALNEFNQTIFGFHFIGNFGYVDNKGFLIFDDSYRYDRENYLNLRIKGIEAINKQKKKAKEIFQDTCWICDGWQQQTFEWNLGKSSQCLDQQTIFIHLEFENFKARFIKRQKSQIKQSYTSMVPYLKDFIYFFTVNGKQMIAQDQFYRYFDTNIYKTSIFIENQEIIVNLEKINKLKNQKKDVEIFSQDYKPLFTVLPRQIENIFIKDKTIQEFQLNFQTSIFRNWQRESDDLINQCFEQDWKQNQLKYIIQNEKDQINIKKIIKHHYRDIINIYKYYQTIDKNNNKWIISKQQFIKFIENINIYDTGNFSINDVNIKWDAIMQSNSLNDFNGISRNQFMELIVRIANERYIKVIQSKNICDSFQKFIKDNLFKEILNNDIKLWRENNLYNYQCNLILEHYQVILVYLFDQYSTQQSLFLQNFLLFCKEICEYDENFNEQDSILIFSMIIYSQIDQQNSILDEKLNYNQFVETFCLCAQKKCLKVFGQEQQNDKISVPLHLKIESLFQQTLQYTTPKIQKQFQNYKKSLFSEKINEIFNNQ